MSIEICPESLSQQILVGITLVGRFGVRLNQHARVRSALLSDELTSGELTVGKRTHARALNL